MPGIADDESMPNEEPTNPGLMVGPEYVKRKLAATQAATRAEMHAEFQQKGRHDWFRTAGVLISALAASVFFVDRRVEAQTDAGVRVVNETIKAQDARLTTLEKRFDRYDAKLDRQSDQLELALDALRVPESKRPAPLPSTADGGR
jgi:hypothetical protein